jgi:L-arabinokinase
VAIGNFTWDWIYADYPRVRLAPSLLPAIRAAYAKASMALRLPMSGGFEPMQNVKDIPFIARHASKTRDEVIRALKLPSEKPIVLMSFGGYGLDALDVEPLTKFKKYTVVTTTNVPLGRARKEAAAERRGSFVSFGEEAVYDAGIRYEDLVGAADAVVTKPGYGIISEAIANNTAVLYTMRGHFPEYDVLIEQMPKYLRNAFISHDDLFAGRWESHLDKLLAQPEPKKKPETNGAEVAADILLKALDKPPRKPRGRVKVKI